MQVDWVDGWVVTRDNHSVSLFLVSYVYNVTFQGCFPARFWSLFPENQMKNFHQFCKLFINSFPCHVLISCNVTPLTNPTINYVFLILTSALHTILRLLHLKPAADKLKTFHQKPFCVVSLSTPKKDIPSQTRCSSRRDARNQERPDLKLQFLGI